MYGMNIFNAQGIKVFDGGMPIFELRYSGADAAILIDQWYSSAANRQNLINQGYNFEGCLLFTTTQFEGQILVGPPLLGQDSYGLSIKGEDGAVHLGSSSKLLQTTNIVRRQDWIYQSDVAIDSYYLGFRRRTWRYPLNGATHVLEQYITKPYVHNHDDGDNRFVCGFGLATVIIRPNSSDVTCEIEYRARAEEIDRVFCDLVTNINLCILPSVMLAKIVG